MLTSSSPAEAPRRPNKYHHETYSYSQSGGVARSMVDAEATTVAPGLQPSIVTPAPLSKRTLLVTDAASDLAADWREKTGVLLLPIKLRNGEMSHIDDGDEMAAARFAMKHLAQFSGPTHTLASSVDATGELIGQHTHDDTDFVLQIAMSSMRSNSYANSLTAAQKLMVQGARDRRRAGNMRPFKMWVVDSAASFNGHGVLIAECARLLQASVSLPAIVQQVDALRRQVKTLVVPRDLNLFHRCAALPEAPVSHWLSRNVGQLFDRTPIAVANGDDLRVMSTQTGFAAAAKIALSQATHCVKAGLDAPFVCASYAGDIADLRHINAFVELSATCAKHGVTLLTSTMSMTNSASLGSGGVLISLATSFDFP
ncbi:MAG: DegV family protein [Casimicrobium sp.]